MPRIRQELPCAPGVTEETARELGELFPVGAAAGERYYPEGLARVDR